MSPDRPTTEGATAAAPTSLTSVRSGHDAPSAASTFVADLALAVLEIEGEETVFVSDLDPLRADA